MSVSLDKLLESGCQSEAQHKVCRSRGGESCAFDGAAIVLMPIADAAHVIHGPISCAGNAWEGRGVHSTAGDFHLRGFTTDVSEMDIVYGAEKKLAETVREVVRREQPKAVFVYSTCVTGLTGEDIDGVCGSLSVELALSVVPVNAPGFVGPKNLGNRIAGEALLEHVIGTAEPTVTTPTDIVIIGEYNVGGDLDLIEPLLDECGIRVLSRITGNATFEEVRHAHRARLSVLVCSRALINVAVGLQRGWAVPYLEVSFFGATEIVRSLRSIAEALELVSPEAVGVRQRVEEVIARRQEELDERLAPYVGALKGKRAILYSGGVKSWSMASALTDLGIEILAVGTKKSSAEDEEKVKQVLGSGVRLIENISPAIIRKIMAEERGDLLVAGGRNRYLAAKEGWPFVDVNQERETAYAGFEGLVNLARDLSASVAFYDRQRRDRFCSLPAAQTPVRTEERVGSIDPLKNAPTLGAALALQGVDRSIPVLHAAQGCTFLGKVLAIRHFNEPIALSTTKLFTEDVVLGSDEGVSTVVRSLVEASSRPDVIALVSGGLAEVRGDDVATLARRLDHQFEPAIIAIRAPDYHGSLEDGYLAAVRSLLRLAEDAAFEAPAASRQVTVLAGSHLSPADVCELKDMVESFGLRPIMLPDLSALDGSREGFSALAAGGVMLADICRLSASAHTLVLGASLEPAAHDLAERFGTPLSVFDAVCGVEATDSLLAALVLLSGRSVAGRFERDRRIAIDAMRDAHLRISGRRVCLALESDHAMSMSAIFDEMAARPVCAIIPTRAVVASRILADEVVVGDLASVPGGIDLLVSNSHAHRTAASAGAVLFETGFPQFETHGASRQLSVGYRGAARVVDAVANLLSPNRTNQNVIGERGSN